jgi:hypothetical protein
MFQYRCVHGAGTDKQCTRGAKQKIKGDWLCKEHEPIPRAGLGYEWPTKIVLGWGFSERSIWKICKSEIFSKAVFHCERCCSEVEVIRKRAPYPKKEYNTPFSGSTYYRNQHYKASAPHKCERYPSAPIKYVNCERCGCIGTKKTVNYNRYPRGKLYHKLCLSCWRIMRPLFALEEQEYEFNKLLRDLKSTMRKAGVSPNVKTPKQAAEINYTEHWHKKLNWMDNVD